MPTQREIHARHESGHALIAWKLGVKIECVTVNETDNYVGQCQTGSATRHQLALISRGGAIAESRYTGRSEADVWQTLATDASIRDLNDSLCEKGCSSADHDHEARQIIEDNKLVLECLAREVFGAPASTEQ